MKGLRRLAGLAVVAALGLMLGNITTATPQAAAAAGGQDAAKPQYTMAEYNAYTAAQATKDPTAQIKALDDFVAKYPNSALLIYVYPLYFNAYSQLKNFPKVIEYADKTLALGDKIDAPVKYQAYYARAFAYTNIQPPPTNPLTIQFLTSVSGSHFAAFFFAIKVLGGLLLLSGYFVPLALTLLAAELYNILAFHLTLAPASIAPALVASVLWILVFLQYRVSFTDIFSAKPMTKA